MNIHSTKCTSTHLIHRNTINYPMPFIFDICLILVLSRIHQRLLTLFFTFNQFGIHINAGKSMKRIFMAMNLSHKLTPLFT